MPRLFVVWIALLHLCHFPRVASQSTSQDHRQNGNSDTLTITLEELRGDDANIKAFFQKQAVSKLGQRIEIRTTVRRAQPTTTSASPTAVKPTTSSQDPGKNISKLGVGLSQCPTECKHFVRGETNLTNHMWCIRNTTCSCLHGVIRKLKPRNAGYVSKCLRPVEKNCFDICKRLPSPGLNVEPFTFSRNGTSAAIVSKGCFAGVYCDCEKERKNGLPNTYGWMVIQRRDIKTSYGPFTDYIRSWKNCSENCWIGLNTMKCLMNENVTMQIEFFKNSSGSSNYYYVKYRSARLESRDPFNISVETENGNLSGKALPDFLDRRRENPPFLNNSDGGWWFTNYSHTNLNSNSSILWGNETYDAVSIKILTGELQNWERASNNLFYRLFKEKRTYDNASAECVKHKAVLASKGIRDENVTEELKKIMNKGGTNVWLGLYKKDNNKAAWKDNVSYDTKFNDRIQHSDGNNDKYGFYSNFNNGTFKYGPGNTPIYFLCEKQL